MIVIWTDAVQHNGPSTTGPGLDFPYEPAVPGAASWTTESTLGRMLDQDILLLVIAHQADARAQHAVMVSDLSQPASDVFDVTHGGVAALGTALDAVVARVRGLTSP